MNSVEKQCHDGGTRVLGFTFEQRAKGSKGSLRPEITTVRDI